MIVDLAKGDQQDIAVRLQSRIEETSQPVQKCLVGSRLLTTTARAV